MLSFQGVLEAWQAGDLPVRQAMSVTGAQNIFELYAFARMLGVKIHTHLTPNEEAAAELATGHIRIGMPEPVEYSSTR